MSDDFKKIKKAANATVVVLGAAAGVCITGPIAIVTGLFSLVNVLNTENDPGFEEDYFHP